MAQAHRSPDRWVDTRPPTGPNRRGPRGNELRNAVIGRTLVNIALMIVWAAHGAGFPWFALVTAPSVIGVGSGARQGRREAVTR